MRNVLQEPEARWFVGAWFLILLFNFILLGVFVWAVIELVSWITSGAGV